LIEKILFPIDLYLFFIQCPLIIFHHSSFENSDCVFPIPSYHIKKSTDQIPFAVSLGAILLLTSRHSFNCLIAMSASLVRNTSTHYIFILRARYQSILRVSEWSTIHEPTKRLEASSARFLTLSHHTRPVLSLIDSPHAIHHPSFL
jgi:hypothetical protein